MRSPNDKEELSEEDRELLRFQIEIEKAVSQLGTNGLILDDKVVSQLSANDLNDKAILRGNLPIPEEYGSYDFAPGERDSCIPIRYIPGRGFIILDE